MSRLLSSTTPTFTQAPYTPLLDSRRSIGSIHDDEELDPNSISFSSNQTSLKNQQRGSHTNTNGDASQSTSTNNPNDQQEHGTATTISATHVLADGFDSDSENEAELRRNSDSTRPQSDTFHRETSGDGSSTVVSIEEAEDDLESLKYGRESFEYEEPNHDDGGDHLGSEESCLAGRRGVETAKEGDPDQGLWMQASSTLVIAVSGLICAGWLLDAVQHWDVFIEISELIILIPILLNLKGNLEMNLASRLSTACNMGLLDSPLTRNAFIKGNLALLQLQGLTVGSVAGLFSFALGMIVHPTTNNLEEIALMISSSMLCASISSFVLGSFMCALVLICRHYRVNPDNIACPLASSFGDLVTLMILSSCAAFLVKFIQTSLCVILLAILLSLIPVWLYYVRRNKFVSEVVKEGWGPVFSAMVIASTAGLTLERYINQFPGMAMISPVLNGLTGNIGSIYASRISTALHANVKESYRATEKTLFLVHIPIEILFLTVIGLLGLGDVQWSASVVFGYAVVALGLVVIALVLAKQITLSFWKYGYDPDNYALPILTSLIDVLGTALLVAGFWILGYGQQASVTG
ncbi:hypothetical protein BX616_011378 [Lobosporangium transversale]|uniref:SLC41A/MgtE integral membrane domain-containing protein n=1 Tax=Lobosporangium transversale TaxID=64571 RepID=A0A1Y2GXW2_9FUNG|nr:hypothetical protein BCR41DRAFT_385135 [Lobosporangium transversale]KAF9908765.1 hypothetical protein BX616_011378 [Lobosporangium transversale]ORZ22873.1 hypothetical protein BCR41DRAFT_385135 [Lobosporangium transversale]|eukprot:XP_021883427.1 hypothetical protein BCR41DRAFT_385135 [Lobosporangium transversale]